MLIWCSDFPKNLALIENRTGDQPGGTGRYAPNPLIQTMQKFS